ncbi:hypothetical protein ACLOJK_004866 [Asimina triloba]
MEWTHALTRCFCRSGEMGFRWVPVVGSGDATVAGNEEEDGATVVLLDDSDQSSRVSPVVGLTAMVVRKMELSDLMSWLPLDEEDGGGSGSNYHRRAFAQIRSFIRTSAEGLVVSLKGRWSTEIGARWCTEHGVLAI